MKEQGRGGTLLRDGAVGGGGNSPYTARAVALPRQARESVRRHHLWVTGEAGFAQDSRRSRHQGEGSSSLCQQESR